MRNLRLAITLIAAAMISVACGDEITIQNNPNIDIGNGGGSKTGFTVNLARFDGPFGSCTSATVVIRSSKPVKWSTDNSGVVSVNNTTTASDSVVVTKHKVGNGQVIATDPVNGDRVIIPFVLWACTSGPDGPTGVTPSMGPFAPRDTTVNINTRFYARGKVVVPVGVTPGILVRSFQGCVVGGSAPTFTASGQPNEYNALVELVGISTTCTNWDLVLKLSADTTKTATLTVRVVSLAGVTISPPGPISGPVGMTGFHTCSATGITNPSSGQADLRCWFYSTDASRGAIVQKDTTFATMTQPWGTGFHFGGEWRHIWPGTVSFCAFSPSRPQYAACALHNVTSGTSGNWVSGIQGPEVLREFTLPKELREVLQIE